MSQRITAVLEGGVLKPLKPLDIPEGREVELQILGVVPTAAEEDEEIRQFEEALDRLQEEAAKYPEEWWDEFQRELRENRMNFEERP
jgi:predicted DNA-binding antitoxin AbrB/MazE fold protein